MLEALAGDRLEALGGHASQYVTAAVGRLLQPLEPVAEVGGWWCSGLDPMANWAAMAWGQLKPDRPWINGEGKEVKYLAPVDVETRSVWLRVPAIVAQLMADRWGLALPDEVAADSTGNDGEFWKWWAREPGLPLVHIEGAKKAGALLSIGVPAVALPGIDNGAKRSGPRGINGRRTGPLELLPELAAVPLEGRPAWVLFDASTREQPREPIAARRLARLLARRGAVAKSGTVPGTYGKGADDHLINGGTWEQLAAALQPLRPEPALPRFRVPDVVAPAGQWLGDACPIPSPDQARLVALMAAMGAGKTEAIAAYLEPLMAIGIPVVLVCHRRSLGEALANRLDLPWAEDGSPGQPLRNRGIALCIDSLCPSSGMRVRPEDWAGCVVVMDEVVAQMAHGLMGTGTAIAKRRPEVLATLSALLKGALQALVSEAALSDDVLTALEDATGHRAYVIGSDHRPAAGRSLTIHDSRDSLRAELVGMAQRRQRAWVATTAKDGPNGAASLGRLVLEHWPEARVLVVDSDTIADPNHDASRLASDPNGIAAAHDYVIASPAVAPGLSVTLRGHFDAVLGFAGGTTDPGAVAQALGRVRDDCPRHLYAPERSPGGELRVGSGSGNPDALLRSLGEHEALIVGQLTAAGADLARGTTGPWLPLWARMAALQNRQRLAYRATVVAMLEREGYAVTDAAPLSGSQAAAATAAAETLKAFAIETQAQADAAVIEAPVISDKEARELERKRSKTPAQKTHLERHRIAKAWGLGSAAPTPELLAADRDGLWRRLRFGWLVSTPEARELAARADRVTAKELASTGSWAPDLCRELDGPRLALADALNLPNWLKRADWFAADDPQLLALHALATSHREGIAQVLGVTPGQRPTTTLRQLLAATGHRLEAKRARAGGGGREASARYRYRVVSVELPPGADPSALQAAWADEIQRAAVDLGAWGGVPKLPLQEGEETGFGTRSSGASPSDPPAAPWPVPEVPPEPVPEWFPTLVTAREAAPGAAPEVLALQLARQGLLLAGREVGRWLSLADSWLAEGFATDCCGAGG